MMRHRESGFTLLEMIIVLAILGLMLGVVVARGPMHSTRLDTEAAARELAGALRMARGRAIAQDQAVSVLVAADRYQVDGMGAHAMPADVSLSGNRVISFAPDGSSSGGTIVVQASNIRLVVAVNWLTGHVDTAAAH
jgi:general secretion pathway protein H